MKLRSLIVIFVAVILDSCSPISERKQPPPSLELLASMDLNLSGEQLANAYCASCHVKPEPEILDKNTWQEKVLPDMRKRMGLYLPDDFGQALPEDLGVPPGVYSKVQLIRGKDWEKILAYYLENAPDSPLPQQKKAVLIKGIPGFQISQPEFQRTKGNLSTMLHVNPQSGELWLGDRLKVIYILDPKNGFQIKDSIPTEVAPVDINWNEDGTFDLLTMGRMDPSNDTLGKVSEFWNEAGTWKSKELLTDLIRPVNLAVADWDGDGEQDRVVSQFGNHFGKMSIYLSGPSGESEVILSSEPGARRAIAVDFDKDGDLDVLGLMAQSKEGIYAWLNEGASQFKEKAILQFQPAFGSSDFRFVDVNGDGHKDIIVVNGDNADLSQVLKNFHGVHIYLNDGENEFEESWFYPMHGASGIEIADFDGDGDQDFFVLSFFPDDSQKPKQNLVYFRQNEKGEFDPFILSETVEGNWLTITSGDADLDGDIDVMVGAFEFDDLYKGATKPWRPFIYLENKLN
ncbi:VCBS repeat-containing protein [Algoriphagus sp. D3-2-R+10]|uniref:FG-GAP repeat domain-containing protein n=1 Tax=Algoriphagus aurantiacus TaxID=3103948 RepID=UPI002B39BE72|nr:VCBS repeat-containing protein [Algoriphagus sp. D3-2-R+10]MEB2774514.1 VCBS repeat-containing protein [Algoriphagus sp. D3-2-R+10]